MVRQWAGAHPPHPVGQSSRRGKDQAWRPVRLCLGGASLPRRSGRPLGVGFCAVPPMAALASPSRRQPQAYVLQAASLAARDALVLQHLPLAVAERFRGAVAIASVMARRLFPLVERDDLIQVAREALLRSLPRCKPGEPAEPYLRRCITGALQHHLRDRVRLVRISRRQHEKGTCPLGHVSLDVQVEGEHSLLDQLEAPAAELASGLGAEELALEQLVEQLPAAQATALRLTLLEGLSLRAAGLKLGISAMALQRAQKKAIAALRLQLVGGG